MTYRLVDLSHTIREGLVTYPGVPAPTITPHLTRAEAESRYAPGTTFVLDIVSLPGNTGTYIDTPFHRYEGGADLAALSLETLVDLPTEVFHVAGATQRGIPASVFLDREVRGKAVLLHTGWDRHFGTPEYAVDAGHSSPSCRRRSRTSALFRFGPSQRCRGATRSRSGPDF